MTLKRRYARSITAVGETSRTKQSFKDDCDINLIVERHASTGIWDHLNPRQPTYGDFTLATALQDAIALVSSADDDFEALPAKVRALCDNDPVKLLQLSSEPGGFAELVNAGLPTLPEHKPATEKPAIIGGEKPPTPVGGKPPDPGTVTIPT